MGSGALGPRGVLAPRRREVLALAAEGLTDAAIAERLYVTRRTVETHLGQVFQKLRPPEAPEPSRARRQALSGSAPVRFGLVADVGEGWFGIATEQKPIELILARSLLDALSTPGCVLDLDGTLVYYNEAVGKLAGMSFEETGAMPVAEWTATFGPFDEAGERIPFEEHPLTVAVRGGRAGHFVQRFSTAEGGHFEVAVTAVPLVGATGFEGAMVFFWPAGGG